MTLLSYKIGDINAPFIYLSFLGLLYTKLS